MEQIDEKIKAEKEALEKLEAEKAEQEKLKPVTKKPLTLEEEVKIMQKDQEKNLKHHAELAKAKDLPKHPHTPIELEGEKFKK